MFFTILIGLLAVIIVLFYLNNNNIALVRSDFEALAELSSFVFIFFSAVYIIVKNPKYVAKPRTRRKKRMGKREKQFR